MELGTLYNGQRLSLSNISVRFNNSVLLTSEQIWGDSNWLNFVFLFSFRERSVYMPAMLEDLQTPTAPVASQEVRMRSRTSIQMPRLPSPVETEGKPQSSHADETQRYF